MSEREWLDGLQAGAKVCIRGFRREFRIETVTYTTRTRVDVGTLRFQRRSGKLISGDSRFYSEYLIQPTPDIEAGVALDRLRDDLQRVTEGRSTAERNEATPLDAERTEPAFRCARCGDECQARPVFVDTVSHPGQALTYCSIDCAMGRSDLDRYDHATAVHALEREREYRRILWAAAATVWPEPLRVSPLCLAVYDPSCEIQKRYQVNTGDALFYGVPVHLPTERTPTEDSAQILSSERSTPDGPRDKSSCPSCLSFSADLASLKAELDATWFHIKNGYDIEDRAYFEKEAPTNGFKYPLAQALHHIWKRDALVEPLLTMIVDLKAEIASLKAERNGQ